MTPAELTGTVRRLLTAPRATRAVASSKPPPVIYVVDDDDMVRAALRDALEVDDRAVETSRVARRSSRPTGLAATHIC